MCYMRSEYQRRTPGATVRRAVEKFVQKHPAVTVHDISMAMRSSPLSRGSGHASFEDVMRGDPVDMNTTTVLRLKDVMLDLAAKGRVG